MVVYASYRINGCINSCLLSGREYLGTDPPMREEHSYLETHRGAHQENGCVRVYQCMARKGKKRLERSVVTVALTLMLRQTASILLTGLQAVCQSHELA